MGEYIGATWRIRLNRPSAAVMQPYVKLDGCIVWNAHNTVLGEDALLIHIVPVGYAM